MPDEAEGSAGQLVRQETRWRLRDTLAAAVLFLGAAAFVVWQNMRVAVLWDLGYLLDTSWRIALGQVPYRDFPLVHPPGTFLIQAAVLRLAGGHYGLVIAYGALAGGLATVVAWRLMLRILRCGPARGEDRSGWTVSVLLALPLVPLGIYSVYPHPIYDCDCALSILIALWWLARVAQEPATGRVPAQALVAGAASVVPLFFKQNMGLPFLAAVAAGAGILLLRHLRGGLRPAARSVPAMVLTGMVAAVAIGFGGLAATVGLGNYFHWTIDFAAQRRLPGVPIMLSVYREPALLWMAPCVVAGLLLCRLARARTVTPSALPILAGTLICAPFAATLVALFFEHEAADRADRLLALWPLWLLIALGSALAGLRRGITLRRLLPFFVLAAIHGTFMSQQLWGSTYALWPLLMVLIAQVLANLPKGARRVASGSAAMMSAVLLISGTLYAHSLERLSYIAIPDAPLEHSSAAALHGMVDRGPYLANLDELIAYAEREIPADDGVITLPGEDPFFFATGRAPQFPVTLFDPTTDPYTPEELVAEVRRRKIRWIIVKRKLQIDDSPMPGQEESMRRLMDEFGLWQQLSGYDVYRVKPGKGKQ